MNDFFNIVLIIQNWAYYTTESTFILLKLYGIFLYLEQTRNNIRI